MNKNDRIYQKSLKMTEQKTVWSPCSTKATNTLGKTSESTLNFSGLWKTVKNIQPEKCLMKEEASALS